ncbi:hypothetical protein A8B79_05980 [Balneola sp. EhC07]|uniref:hypothetical protein n=1 Tax=Balneola sp. EhC07 TaxID=1849360 RepID=UPI0007F3638C|nr:hypothetical protein [Balneola sp. EhC07]OAN61022.1 hypothetical protein A8B79_05980 [Balneola sp. EhC07]
MSSGYLLIPVELCKYAITNHIEDPLFTFLLLKKLKPGILKNNTDLKNQLSGIRDNSTKTISRDLKRLIDLNFISLDHKTKLMFIKSWSDILDTIGAKHETGVLINPLKIEDAQAFCAGAVIGRLVNESRQNYKRLSGLTQKRHAGVLTGRNEFVYRELSNRAFAEICEIAVSTAHKLKSKAFRHQYIILKKNKRPIIIGNYHIDLDIESKKEFIVNYPEYSQIVIQDGKAYSVESDLIKSRMIFKKSCNFI